MHFSEIIKLQFDKKKKKNIHCFVFWHFWNYYFSITSKRCVATPIFVLESNSPRYDLLFQNNSNKLRKNTLILVGTIFISSLSENQILRHVLMT